MKKSKVEITRDGWNMLFNCFKGPTKKVVLVRRKSVSKIETWIVLSVLTIKLKQRYLNCRERQIWQG